MDRMTYAEVWWARAQYGNDRFQQEYVNEPAPESEPQRVNSGRRIHNLGHRIDIGELHRGFALTEWLPRGAVITATIHLARNTRFDGPHMTMEFEDQHLVTLEDARQFEFQVKTDDYGRLLSTRRREITESTHSFDPVNLRMRNVVDVVSRPWNMSEINQMMSVVDRMRAKGVANPVSPVEAWNA